MTDMMSCRYFSMTPMVRKERKQATVIEQWRRKDMIMMASVTECRWKKDTMMSAPVTERSQDQLLQSSARYIYIYMKPVMTS